MTDITNNKKDPQKMYHLGTVSKNVLSIYLFIYLSIFRRPRLMSVKDQCCKQWTCDVHQRPDSESGIKPRHAVMVAKPSELRMKQQAKGQFRDHLHIKG